MWKYTQALPKNRTMIDKTDQYRVKLDIFEGPMDLLLYLIQKAEVDIYDIPIALIVGQYNEYIKLMQHLNLDLAGEFLVMAATLSNIKSKMLLPRPEGEDEEEGEDPRAELVRKLLEYSRYKEAAESLNTSELLGRDVFVRKQDSDKIAADAKQAGIPSVEFVEVGVFHLFDALSDVFKRAKIDDWHEVTMEHISITERISQILEIFQEMENVSFEQLFTEVTDKIQIIVTFLAILELVRLQVLKAFQSQTFGTIRLRRAVDIDDAMKREDNVLNLMNDGES